ncbi:MAG: hypothetical protein IPP56_16450 [Bacteroidetes bacterium]|nr:hypothetical protein [Bacteroidota bacterium]MBK9801237.1 hypothetical protein [Bacteroidota bacterium]
MTEYYYENLPEKCPPENSFTVENRIFYRLVQNDTLVESDFHSHKKIWPNKKFQVSDCIAHSLSMLEDFTSCFALTKLPALKTRKVAAVLLTNTDGPLLQTGNNTKHYSWWRAKTFNLNGNIVTQ